MDKYFIYDPGNDSFETFATLSEQAKASEEIIAGYLDNNDEWPEEVGSIVSGIINEIATRCEIKNRPPESELDEDGFDEDGQNWSGDFTYICNYEMAEV
ncbi:MAG: hypothetical protein KAW47_05105 [Thermoplasmatales archaeon]|nr:hypothetical protein [Thermoplasmatales archaeon]